MVSKRNSRSTSVASPLGGLLPGPLLQQLDELVPLRNPWLDKSPTYGEKSRLLLNRGLTVCWFDDGTSVSASATQGAGS